MRTPAAAGVFFAACAVLAAWARPQAPAALSPATAADDGVNFQYQVPAGWVAADAALTRRRQAAVALVADDDPVALGNVIAIKILHGVDTDPIRDLNDQFQQYRDKAGEVAELDLKIEPALATYNAHARLLFIPTEYYDYVAYISPGKAAKFMLYVALTGGRQVADPAQVDAFKAVVHSLTWRP